MEVAYLLLFGELPTLQQFSKFESRIMKHTMVHKDIGEMQKSFRYDAHPMGMLVSTIAALSTLHPEANPALQGSKIYKDPKFVNKQIYRLLGNLPTLAANAYRHRIGRDFNDPNTEFGYVENFLFMLDKLGPLKYKPHPVITRALDILFILHAEHELNCSTAAVRHLASSGVDVYTVVSGAAAALYGPLHGGANEAVLRMLEEIGTKDKIPAFIEDVKNKKRKLMGFGHRVYRNYDPRAKIIKGVAEEVFAIVGKEPLIELAIEIEKIALSDEYFIKKKLYPNVDFYTGVIYKALGFPTDMFPILFAIPRTVGWLAHWKEYLGDKENSIVRPRQYYVGSGPRNYIPVLERDEKPHLLEDYESAVSKRRTVSMEYRQEVKKTK